MAEPKEPQLGTYNKPSLNSQPEAVNVEPVPTQNPIKIREAFTPKK